MHDFIMFFVVNRKQTASYIWDHGDIPKRWEHGDPLPDCGAKQLMLSRLSTHYRAWFNQETLDADTKAAFLELLASLAAGYYFGNTPVHVSRSKAGPQPRLFDFTDGGLAYLELVRAVAPEPTSSNLSHGTGCVLGHGARYETQGSCKLGAAEPTAAARGQCYGTCGPPSHRAWRVFVPRAGVCVHPRSWATARFSCALRAGLWAQLL